MKFKFLRRNASGLPALRRRFLAAFLAGPNEAAQCLLADERTLEAIRGGFPADDWSGGTVPFGEWCILHQQELALAELLRRSPAGLGYYDVCSRDARAGATEERRHHPLHIAAILHGSPHGLRLALQYAPGIETEEVLCNGFGAQRHYVVATRLARCSSADRDQAARLAEVCRLLLGHRVELETSGQRVSILGALLGHPWSEAVAPLASRLIELHRDVGVLDIDADVPSLGPGSPVEIAALMGNAAAVQALFIAGCETDVGRSGYAAGDLFELVARYGVHNKAQTSAAIARGLMERVISKAAADAKASRARRVAARA